MTTHQNTISRHVDVAILGAGTAGLRAQRSAKAEGASVLMIDPGPLGTTCARVGCMPSKLLIAAAEAAHRARRAPMFGVHAEKVRVDGKAVLARLQRERDRFVGFVEQVTDTAAEENELLVGRGRIVAPGRLLVDETTEVTFDRLVVATGSSPLVPPPFRALDRSRLLTNEDVFELEDLPESLLVIGLGVIGLELGQAFGRLGVRTTLLGIGGRVAQLRDPVVNEEAKRVFARELDLHSDYELKSIEPVEKGVSIHFTDSAGKERRETFTKIVMAAGRKPNLHDIGLEAMGITPDERGRYAIDSDTLQIGDHPVFVAGDVNNLHPLLHEAADDGHIAGANAVRYPDGVRAARRRTPLSIVFSDPQIAVVGGGYDALGACATVAGEVDYGDQGRARVQGMNVGKARIYAERRSGRLLGAEMLGPRVEHTAHLLAWAVQQGLTVEQALDMPFYHPVLEEGIRTALRDLSANRRHGAAIKCRFLELVVSQPRCEQGCCRPRLSVGIGDHQVAPAREGERPDLRFAYAACAAVASS